MGFFFRVAIWATCLSTSLLAAPLESPSVSPLNTTTNMLATRDMPTHSIQILSLKDDKNKNIQFSVFSGPYGAGVDPCNPGSKGFKHIGNYDSGIHWAGEAYPSYFELGFMYLPFEANWPFPKEDVLFPVDSDCAIKGPKERELAAPHAFSAEDALLKGWLGQPSPAQLRCGNNLIYDFELESMWNQFDIVCDGGTGQLPRFKRTWVVEY